MSDCNSFYDGIVTTADEVANITIVNPDQGSVAIVERIPTVVTINLPGPQGPQGPKGDSGTAGEITFIASGSVTASVGTNPNSLFLIRSANVPHLSISASSETTIYSDFFLIKNFTTKQPVLTVSQSIVQFATHSVDPTGDTQAGSIYFTSASFYVGLE